MAWPRAEKSPDRVPGGRGSSANGTGRGRGETRIRRQQFEVEQTIRSRADSTIGTWRVSEGCTSVITRTARRGCRSHRRKRHQRLPASEMHIAQREVVEFERQRSVTYGWRLPTAGRSPGHADHRFVRDKVVASMMPGRRRAMNSCRAAPAGAMYSAKMRRRRGLRSSGRGASAGRGAPGFVASSLAAATSGGCCVAKARAAKRRWCFDAVSAAHVGLSISSWKRMPRVSRRSRIRDRQDSRLASGRGQAVVGVRLERAQASASVGSDVAGEDIALHCGRIRRPLGRCGRGWANARAKTKMRGCERETRYQ